MMILWIDFETTGLDPRKHFLLELAAILTDSTLEEVDGHHQVMHFDWDATTCATLAGEIVFEMHTTNGLWEECRRGSYNLLEQELIIIQMMIDAGIEPRTCRLGGSTINFDRDWLLVKMPHLYEFLHYRNFDISTLKVTQELWRPDLTDVSPSSSGTHRARADIIDSINYAKWYRDFVILPQGPTT